MKFTIILMTSVAGMLATALCQAKPAQTPDDWKTECIGYFNISVPGEVDIALSAIDGNGRITNPRFSYARIPMLSGLVHGGQFQVTRKVPFEIFVKQKQDEIAYLDKLAIDQAKTGGAFKSYDSSRDDFMTRTFADSEGTTVSSSRWAGAHMYLHSVDTTYYNFNDARLNAYVSEFSDKFRPRKLYEIPQEPGYCIPYGFVENQIPQHPRKLAMAMVLKDHPDVTIDLREWGIPPHARKPVSAKDSIKEFWQVSVGGRADKMQVLGFPSFPSVEMGGQKGRSVFVEITWPEKCGHEEISFDPHESLPPIVCEPPFLDYGYMAYVSGEPSEKEDKPNLTLIVMRDSEYGPGGKPTIGKDELRKMAETIAASVTRR